MACIQWFQLILASFGWYTISTGHFPQKNLSGNPRIGFSLSPLPDHTLLRLTHDPSLPVLAGYRLVMSGPCVCSTSVFVQNLPAAHVFVVVWRLLYTFCPPSLTSYGVSYFLIFHSLWPAPFRHWALLDCWLFFLQPTLLLLFVDLLPFPTVPLYHSCCDVYLTQASWASLGLLLILLSMTQYDHWAFYYIACRLLCPIYFL